MVEFAGSPKERADALLAKMTLREKTMQLVGTMTTNVAGLGVAAETLASGLGDGIGHLAGAQTGDQNPADIARSLNAAQRYLVENTRLGIPAIVHSEALNGVFGPGFSVFPTSIALAATWDTAGVEEMSTIMRAQLRSIGVHQALSPVLDVARDARWGRIHETYGEDPYLVSAMGVSYVRGMQGEDLTEGIIATAKHFLGYSVTEGGQNMAATHFGPRELYDVYATPFEAAIKLANLGSVMNSYSEIDGVPVGADYQILTELLRDKMGFTGSVVSDYSTVAWIKTRQGAADTLEEAAILAVSAGLDVELPNPLAYPLLEDAVREGRLDEAILDRAVHRVLVDKFRLGLFDSPYVAEDDDAIAETAALGKDLSRRLADESITLIKNNGALPLAPDLKRIAVIGPHADGASVNFPAYTFVASIDMFKGLIEGTSRMAGVDDMLAGAMSGDEVPEVIKAILSTDSDQVARYVYDTPGLWEAIQAAAPHAEVSTTTGVGVLATEPQDIAAAVRAAHDADVVILAVGGRGGWYGNTVTEGEGTDSAHVELPAHQVELVRAIAETGKPVIGVVYQGRPYALTEVEPFLDAILIAYYSGPEAPRAVASILVGETNPSGKLPYSLPRASGQVPVYYGQKRGSGYRRAADENYQSYVDESNQPLYPFGHGLSYTQFEYEPLTLSTTEAEADGGQVTATVTVRNTGDRDGAEIVQLYVADTATGVTRPALALVGFARLPLAAGEEAAISFNVQTSQLGYTGVDGRFIIEPGPIQIHVGASCDDIRSTSELLITGTATNLEGRRSYLSTSTILSPVGT